MVFQFSETRVIDNSGASNRSPTIYTLYDQILSDFFYSIFIYEGAEDCVQPLQQARKAL